MEVYLIRHTQTIVDKDVCYGQSDLPLKEPFFKEFDKILNQVKVEQPKIYSSPLSRCSLLANYFHLHNKSQHHIKYDDRLKELNFGQWELKKWDKIEPKPLNIIKRTEKKASNYYHTCRSNPLFFVSETKYSLERCF